VPLHCCALSALHDYLLFLMMKNFILLSAIVLGFSLPSCKNLDEPFLQEIDQAISNTDSLPNEADKIKSLENMAKNLEPYKESDPELVPILMREMEKIFNNIIRDYGRTLDAMKEFKKEYESGEIELDKARVKFGKIKKQLHALKKSFYSIKGVSARDPRILIQQGAETTGKPASAKAMDGLDIRDFNKEKNQAK